MTQKSLGYEDVGLVSRKISTLKTREEADTTSIGFGSTIKIPIISSPMADVTDGDLAAYMRENGGYGFIHRFQTIDQQVNEYKKVKQRNLDCGCAIGIKGDFLDRFITLANVGCRSFCLDTANGANIQVRDAISNISIKIGAYFGWIAKDFYLTAGNVYSKEGCEFLANLPIHAIRLSVGTGFACSTRYQTGCYNKPISVLQECFPVKKDKLLIMDGGIHSADALCKALAFGADFVMVGSIIAACQESPAKAMRINDKLFKVYRGAASFASQEEISGKRPDYVEGYETLLEYNGPLFHILNRFIGGLKSAMSYFDARTLEEFRKNMDWTIL